jgi:hypothetical protein
VREEARRTAESEVVHKPDNSLFHFGNIKIQQITEMISAKFQVAQELSPMNVGKLLDRFDFDHHDILDQEVEPIAGVYRLAIVQQGKDELALIIQTSLPKLMSEASLISAFQQSRSERDMYPDRAAKNHFANGILIHSTTSALLRVLSGKIDSASRHGPRVLIRETHVRHQPQM